MADSIDRRATCRFGVRCYQKNPEHHKKYKHPPKRTNQDIKADDESKAKRIKSEDKPVPVVAKPMIVTHKTDDKPLVITRNIAKFSNDISASEDEENSNSNDTLTNPIDESSKSPNPSEIKPYKNLNVKKFIKEKFLVEMPEDFYQFWEFCKRLDGRNPSMALYEADLVLVGPYDALNGKFRDADREFTDDEFLIHWRYYYDTPEFQTVLKGNDKTGYHIGYFRDEPEEKPVFLACNFAQKDGLIYQLGDNIFAAVCLYLEDFEKQCSPFQKMKITSLIKAVKHEADTLNYSMAKKTEEMKARDRKVVTKTFNKIGLVVPFNRKTELGYRDLYMEEKELAKTLQRIRDVGSPNEQEKMFDKLQPLFTYTSIAIDECDFGTGVELGWDLLFYGIDALNATTARFLRNAYNLLDRDAFVSVITAHMDNRRRGGKLSILERN